MSIPDRFIYLERYDKDQGHPPAAAGSDDGGVTEGAFLLRGWNSKKWRESAVGFPPKGWMERQSMRQALYQSDPRSRTLVLSHEDCLGHLPRSESDWECPERIQDVMRAVGNPHNFDPEQGELEVTSDFDKAPVELLARAHSKEYIKFVTELARRMRDMAAQKGGDNKVAPVPFTPQVQKHMATHKPDQSRGERVKTVSKLGLSVCLVSPSEGVVDNFSFQFFCSDTFSSSP